MYYGNWEPIESLLPRSNATNGWDLCEDVCQAILEEPKRVDMNDTLWFVDPRNANAPACGTVGCFAGWVNVLAGNLEPGWMLHKAKMLLGGGLIYSLPTTDFALLDYEFFVFNSGYGDGIHRMKVGTPEYAEAVVGRIRLFMQRNEAGLRARAFVRVGNKLVSVE